jgi:pyruvate kinase
MTASWFSKWCQVDTQSFDAEVVVGGPLKSRKGVNLPDIILIQHR